MEMNGLSETRRSNVVQGFNGARLHNGLGDCDPWTSWACKPRIISLLLMGTCVLIWASGALDPESTASHNIVTSVNRVLIRPHPTIWRLVHGMVVIYLIVLTFLLFQIHSRVYRIHACSVSFLEHRRHQFAGSTTLHMETRLGYLIVMTMMCSYFFLWQNVKRLSIFLFPSFLGDADLLESLRL